MDFPELETSRLMLTMLSVEDSRALLDIYSDEKVIEFCSIDVYSTEDQSLKLIEFFNSRFTEAIGIRWAIRIKETGKLIGTCGFNSWNREMQSADIGCELSSIYWSYGYATEAVHKIITSAFLGQLPLGELYRIQGETLVNNVASQAVLKKLGFIEEGVRRSCSYWKNEFHDMKCFGLLKPEFKEI